MSQQREVDRGEDLHPFRDAGPAAVPDPLVEELDPARILADQPPAHDLSAVASDADVCQS